MAGKQTSNMLGTQPKILILLFSLLLVSVIGIIDARTGWEVSMFVLYAVPIILVVWSMGREAGIALAILCTVIWWGANRTEHPYQSTWGYWQATLSRFIYFLIAAWGSAAVKARQDAERARVKAMERTRELEQEIVRVSEHEQQRIGRDLHDGICQQLAAIGCAAKALADDLETKFQSEAAAALEIEAMLKDAISETRSLARGIYPVQLGGVGLSAGLADLAATVSRLTMVKVAYHEKNEPQTNDPEQAMHLYRIAQEALNNAIRHGGAGKVDIHLSAEHGKLILIIQDDGKGLPASVDDSKGMGLRTMQYRARVLDAEMTIESKPDHGTTVKCVVFNHPPPCHE